MDEVANRSISLYMRAQAWVFDGTEIWGPIFIAGLLLFTFGLSGLLPRIQALRAKKKGPKS